jgi:hypothetical protein
MAYLFDGVDDRVEFSKGALAGYAVGAITIAMFFKRAATGAFDYGPGAYDSAGTGWRVNLYIGDTDTVGVRVNATSRTALAGSVTSTALWYLAAVTWAGAGTTPRMHLHDGTSWTHANASSTIASNYTLVAGDRLFFGGASSIAFGGDVVCAGIKKADSNDAAIETLTRTAFQSWRDFAFDWLVGFDSSLEAAGVLQDQSTVGTGDEIAITGTAPASDPPGWAWTGSGGGGSTFVPQIAIVT